MPWTQAKMRESLGFGARARSRAELPTTRVQQRDSSACLCLVAVSVDVYSTYVLWAAPMPLLMRLLCRPRPPSPSTMHP